MAKAPLTAKSACRVKVPPVLRVKLATDWLPVTVTVYPPDIAAESVGPG
jgi:hypothetical protein